MTAITRLRTARKGVHDNGARRDDGLVALLKFSAEVNAETVREQQQHIAKLESVLNEILADDRECGYLNASLSLRIHQALGNTEG